MVGLFGWLVGLFVCSLVCLSTRPYIMVVSKQCFVYAFFWKRVIGETI
jgi:hypothetical protein